MIVFLGNGWRGESWIGSDGNNSQANDIIIGVGVRRRVSEVRHQKKTLRGETSKKPLD